MILKTPRLFTLALLYLLFSNHLAAQSNFTGLNGAVINLPCNQTCLTPLKIAHLKKPSDYTVSSITYAPYEYVTPGGTEDPALYFDDKYSVPFNLPFAFCFYDSSYKNAVIGSNGLVTFDESNNDPGPGGCANSYHITQLIPFAGGTQCSDLAPYYPKASIMGAYSDLNPLPASSPADRKIEWRVEGTDPFRRFVVSFYHVGVFGNDACGLAKPTTFQIVIYESTGYIEVFIDQKLCQPNSPGGSNAILGIQNWARDKAVWAPGKNRTVWSESHTGYRFTPSGPVSRYLKSELYDMANNLIGNADTSTTTQGFLDLNFSAACAMPATGKYIVKTTFASCDGSNDVVVSDTITVNKTNGLAATAAFTQASCGQNDGTITVTVPPGIGTPPISYSLDGGTPQTSNVFTGVAAGPHTIHAQDASNGCSSDVPVTVTPTGVLTVNYIVNNTSCNGASNGSINVTPPVGTAPITYTLNGVPSTNNVFNNLAPGNYTLDVADAAGCQKLGIAITVGVGPFLTFTSASTPTSCAGANNGTITISNVVGGVGPFVYSINAGVYQASNVFTNLPPAPAPGGHFILVKDLGTNCTSLLTIVPVAQGASTLGGTAIPTATSCAGVNNGSIVVTATGQGAGLLEYSLNGTVWQTSNTFTGLAPGTYSNIRVREAGLCTSPAIAATVTAGTGLTAVATPTATSCAGVNNGSISVTSTGTAPFTFVLDGTVTQTSPTATHVFNNLASGPHSVTVTDAAGCTTTAPATATIGTGTGFTATFNPSATSCAGASNGILIITPQSPGTAPFTFVLSPGNITQTGSTTTYPNLAAGTYSVLITDANGCQFTLSNMNITAGGGLTASATSTPTTCAGVNNGTVIVTTNGTAPFTMVLDGTITQTSVTTTHTFNNVGAGAHSVTITDAAGCVTTTPVTTTVTAGTGFTATVSGTNTTCAGVNNGSLLITPALPGAAPFTFVLTPGNITQTGTTTTFTNLAPNTYSALITDANGCQFTLNNMVISGGAGLTASATSTTTTCAGVNNGTITVTTNGTAPFTMVLDGTITQTSATTTHTFNNVGTGAHSITITDATGCITTTPVTTTVTAGTGYTATFTPTATTCTGVSNGLLEITPQLPGVGPFTFVLSPGNITQTGATTIFNNLAPGTYSVLITDANGCQTSQNNITVTQGAGLQATVDAVAVACFGAANGSITVTPTNGSGPFTFVLNPGAVTQTGAINTTFANLPANNYTVTITDAAGCVSSALSKAVSEPAALTAVAPAVQHVRCNGASNGVITAGAPAGGTPPYNYSLDNVNWQPSPVFNVPQGTYTLYVRDSKSCVLTFPNTNVTQPAVLTAVVANTGNATCSGGADGSIQITANGGTAPYQYSSDGTNFQASNVLNTIAGTYTITVRDANNCSFSIPDVVVGQVNNLTLTTITPPPICEGTNVQLQINSNGATYSWTSVSATPNLSSTTVASPVASPTVTTQYTVTATLGNCTRTADVTVTVLPAPVAEAGTGGEICFGQSFQLHASGGNTYSWTPATFLNNSLVENPQVVKPDKTMTYSVTVTDANNCTSLTPDDVTVTVTPPIKIVTTPVDTVVYAGATFQIQAISAATIYTWTPTIGMSNPGVPNPIVTAGNVGDVVNYKVVASTPAGCQGEAVVTVRVYTGPDIYVPTAFTPNADGKNDVFTPFPVGIKQINYFRIFNRWGNLIFATSGLNNGWDGRSGVTEQASGVYVWMVQGVTQTGQIINKQGTVTLIR